MEILDEAAFTENLHWSGIFSQMAEYFERAALSKKVSKLRILRTFVSICLREYALRLSYELRMKNETSDRKTGVVVWAKVNKIKG